MCGTGLSDFARGNEDVPGSSVRRSVPRRVRGCGFSVSVGAGGRSRARGQAGVLVRHEVVRADAGPLQLPR